MSVMGRHSPTSFRVAPVSALVPTDYAPPRMDLSPNEAERALRDECRAWLREQPARGSTARGSRRASTTSPTRSRSAGSGRPSSRRAGGSGVAWPEEYGGRDAGPGRALHRHRGARRARAPELVGRIGVNLVGPTLLARGTPEQQARWLPKILDADGAVVPAVQRAERGQRPREPRRRARRAPTAAGCSTGRRCGRATRSSPTGACASPAPIPTRRSNKGISYLVVDMRAPGVEVRPLRQITDETDFNEVFFSDVFVPEDRIIGPENEGWQVANPTLTHERGVNPRQLVIHTQLVEELLRARDRERRVRRPPQRAAPGRGVRRGADLPAAQLALDLAHREGEAPGPVGSINKLWWSEMSKRLHDTAMTVLGPAAPLWRGARRQPGRRRVAALVALLPGVVDLGRARTRSSAT